MKQKRNNMNLGGAFDIPWRKRFENQPTRNVFWMDQRTAKEDRRTIAEFAEDFPNVANLFAGTFPELVKQSPGLCKTHRRRNRK